MKQRFFLLLKAFLGFTLLSVLFKPIFMIYNHSLYNSVSFFDYFKVIYHGLTMDMSVAGYLTIIPALLLIVSVWIKPDVIRLLQRIYFIFISILLPLIYLVDMVLYSYWGFRLDTTPLFYFFTSPKDAIASVSIWFVIFGVVVYLLLVLAFYVFFNKTLVKNCKPIVAIKSRYKATAVMFVCAALLFLPIRGSLTTSTMNLGRAYFSQNQRLNHAAINPCFSLLTSAVGNMKTDDMYRFMKPEEANRLFAQLRDTTTVAGNTKIPQLLNTRRPNVIVVILESFSAKIMATMGGTPNVAVNMDRLGQEGVLFTNFYANSFRTDRGLASILAAYPAQPTTSIMKYPSKTGTLPMFPKELLKAGYDLKYYYGGDADFTDMRSFLVTAGFEKIICDKDFPAKLRLSKWGAPDEYVFQKALDDLRHPVRTPFLKVIQTSSSHEPYDVPYHRLSNERLNAFAYTDHCLGEFVNKLKTTPYWKNTLIILVPDHLGVYPENIDNYAFDRYHIPLIFVGGAVKAPTKVLTYGSQIDIAATVLSQLGLSYKMFQFSKDMMNPHVPHFGFSTIPNAFSMVSPDDSVFFNCETNKVLTDKGRIKGKNLPYGKAFLQKLYDDLSRR